ncbi:MAG TPA: Hpt domain-containing protein, partial [Candidatus Caenarcaniphilales bacterium]
MQPEQQRIMGYFIEEAKEHLDTMEQGLLNLQSIVEEPEMLNEVFRAVHSVKGGAAMLGITSIQQTAHWLEDYFKVLKEHPIKVDQKLESLFFQGFDTLQGLLEQLQGPFGLTDDVADTALQEVEQVFAELEAHLALLVGQAGQEPTPAQPQAKAPLPEPQATNDFLLIFKHDVPVQIRGMLQLFRQADQPGTRQQLQQICQSLAQLGAQSGLLGWRELAELASLAIAVPQNSYAILAPILIK